VKICPNCGQTYPTHFVLCPQDGQTLTEADVWSEGTVIREKYRILGKIGSGGMATVYKAQHVDFKELRALKVISPELARDESFARRFKQEAVVTRMLHHPNAVRVEDIDKAEDGRPFIVMEYIDGRSLKEVIQNEGPIPVKRACRIAKNVASALDAAHALGMVHRDIKPANIVLVETKSGEQAKVLDFGIAKVKEGLLEDSKLKHMTLTGTGAVVGTPAYMSPEQAKGMKGDQLDGRSDIYSLGVAMYQMLAGELPLNADSEMQMMMAQINTKPKPIQQRRKDVPSSISRLVMQCLEKNRDHRPASGRAVVEAIERWERESTPVAVPKERREAGEPEGRQGVGEIGPHPDRPIDSSGERREAGVRLKELQFPRTRKARLVRQMLVPSVIAAGLLATGVWYVASKPDKSGSQTRGTSSINENTSQSKTKLENATGQSEPAPRIPLSVDASAAQRNESPPLVTKSRARHTSAARSDDRLASAPTPAALSPEVQRQIKGAITEGDVDADDGMYDAALKAYSRALQYAGSDIAIRGEIQRKIQRAKKAKGTEAADGILNR